MKKDKLNKKHKAATISAYMIFALTMLGLVFAALKYNEII